jgi:hypothetical protein
MPKDSSIQTQAMANLETNLLVSFCQNQTSNKTLHEELGRKKRNKGHDLNVKGSLIMGKIF